jgi:hypothetical protein
MITDYTYSDLSITSMVKQSDKSDCVALANGKTQ